MKKNDRIKTMMILSLILALTLLLFSLFVAVKAETTFDVSPYIGSESHSSGVMVGLSGGENFLYQVNVSIANNFGGLSVGVGKQVNQVSLYIGVMDIIRMESGSGYVDVAGVPVLDNNSDGSGAGVYFEAEYKNFFARIMHYSLDYTYSGARQFFVPNPPFAPLPVIATNQRTETITGELLMIGYRFKLR